MMTRLHTEDDEAAALDLIGRDENRRLSEWLLSQLTLIIAGIVIISSATFTLLNLRDEIILSVLVPGFLIGIFFIGLYIFRSKRIRERHKLVFILKKTKGADQK